MTALKVRSRVTADNGLAVIWELGYRWRNVPDNQLGPEKSFPFAPARLALEGP